MLEVRAFCGCSPPLPEIIERHDGMGQHACCDANALATSYYDGDAVQHEADVLSRKVSSCHGDKVVQVTHRCTAQGQAGHSKACNSPAFGTLVAGIPQLFSHHSGCFKERGRVRQSHAGSTNLCWSVMIRDSSFDGGERQQSRLCKLSIANLRILMPAGFLCSRADDRGKAKEHLN